MALTSANVRTAVTGGVHRAPTTAAAPTATTSALTGFTELGYVSDEGVTETRSRSTNDIRAWQNGDLVRTVVTDSTVTFSFTLLETTRTVLEAFHGTAATTGVGEGSIQVRGVESGGRYSWVIDVIDGAHATRIYIAEGEVTEVGDVTYANGEAIRYGFTITAYPVNGVAATKFSTALAA